MWHLESSGSNFELYLLANREPVQANQNRSDVTVTRFLSYETGRVFCTSGRLDTFCTDVPAKRELQ